MRGLNHQVALDLTAGQSEISGNLEPPAYGVVLLDEDAVTVHMHDFMDSSPEFSLHSPESVDPVRYQLDMVHAGFKDL
jgi:Icc protein